MLLIADILVIRCTVNYYECVENRLVILHTLEEVGYFKTHVEFFIVQRAQLYTTSKCSLRMWNLFNK